MNIEAKVSSVDTSMLGPIGVVTCLSILGVHEFV